MQVLQATPSSYDIAIRSVNDQKAGQYEFTVLTVAVLQHRNDVKTQQQGGAVQHVYGTSQQDSSAVQHGGCITLAWLRCWGASSRQPYM